MCSVRFCSGSCANFLFSLSFIWELLSKYAKLSPSISFTVHTFMLLTSVYQCLTFNCYNTALADNYSNCISSQNIKLIKLSFTLFKNSPLSQEFYTVAYVFVERFQSLHGPISLKDLN